MLDKNPSVKDGTELKPYGIHPNPFRSVNVKEEIFWHMVRMDMNPYRFLVHMYKAPKGISIAMFETLKGDYKDNLKRFGWPHMLFKITESSITPFVYMNSEVYKSPFPNDSYSEACTPMKSFDKCSTIVEFITTNISLYLKSLFTEWRNKNWNNCDIATHWATFIMYNGIHSDYISDLRIDSYDVFINRPL